MHCGAQLPATQSEPDAQGTSFEHSAPVAWGRHAPRSHVNPEPQGFWASHPLRHWPSAQIWLAPHSLENAHVLAFGVHEPATQTSFALHSAWVEHGQGPFVPPQALQRPDTHADPDPQSVLSVHSWVFGGVVTVGGMQTPVRQTSPRGQASSVVHFCEHPMLVQTALGPQTALFRHVGLDGVGTVEQPKPSHV